MTGALSEARDPESYPVGEGPLYETLRSEAKKLAESWVPNGVENYQSYWGAGICGVIREDDKNIVAVDTFGRGRNVAWAFGGKRLSKRSAHRPSASLSTARRTVDSGTHFPQEVRP